MPTRGERLTKAIAARHRGKMLALAQDLGVDESAISRWKRGGPISLDHAAKLCTILDISLDWLILGRGDPDIHRQRSISPSQSSILSSLDLLSERARTNLAAFLNEATTPASADAARHLHNAQDNSE